MALSQFHPASRAWFTAQFGEATEVQAQAWPAIKSGRHTLISAPTGSGKTLAAFYAAIDALLVRGLQRQLHPGVQILYVSPLKALSNDIHKNLEIPLKGIAENLRSSHQTAVDISIAVRTGDTPASARQKMAKNPPHILVTTPESLYLLLSSASGRAMLANVATVIVDEIHAMLGDKRGSHLALSIERLQNLVLKNSGQGLQRIGLSATQRPIEMVAKYLVGNNNCQQGIVDCEIIDAGFRRRMDIRLEVPGSPLSALMSNEVWEELYQRLVELISSHQTTLVFVNTRRLSERLALALAERLGNEAVCSHHGSMSKDLRHDAEQRLKAGKLKVLVATASMELGIDIGSVDLVVQFSSPKSIATFLQRIGRSGHSIHGTPKGILFPLTRDDLVESTALLHCIKQGELDCIVMPEMPLDILSQQIVAEVSSQAHDRIGQSGELFDQQESGWDVEELFNLFRNAYSYRNLQRKQFDSIVKMLADGYTSRRGRRGTHLHFDAINKRIRARRGANLIALTNGGAIPDMFDYQVVLDPEDIVVGSLNEDFALEALPGDIFTLGTHSWQLLRVDGLKVRVRDAQGMQATIPFWFGEGIGRTRELSDAVSTLRQTIADLLVNDSANAAVQWLLELAGLPHSAATQIVEYLETGMNALGLMPTRSTIVMERFFDEVGDMHVVIHSPFGSRINRGWGLALRKRFCKSFNFELQAAANEDSIVISLGTIHSFPLDDVFKYLQSATVKDVLVQALLDAPMFEVRWRWNATRALAIQRNRNGKRVPPQFQRMDAEDLVAHVFPDQLACAENISGRREVPDHPLVNQTIHDCLTEAMDIEQLTELITDIEQDKLTLVAKDLREPSPFAQEIINARPYAFLDDAPFEERRTNAIRNRSWTDPGEAKDFSLLDEEAIARVRDEAWPFINNVEEFHDGLLSLGYMTEQEFESNQYQRWQQVLLDAGRILKLTTAPKLIWIATEKLACFSALFPQLQLPKNVPDFILQTKWEREDALREIVRCRLECLGPTRPQQLATELGLRLADIDMALLALEVEGYAFQGQFTPSARTQLTDTATRIEWCERRLLQRIHRYSIDAHRKSIKPVSLQTYTEFLFERHQLVAIREHPWSSLSADMPSLDGQTSLQNTLGLLDGITAAAGSWEADLYPARVADYDPAWLDQMCVSGKIVWGRYSIPNAAQQPQRGKVASRGSSSGPIRSTPISIVTRANLDIFKALFSAHQREREEMPRSELAKRIESDLEKNGASFFDQIQRRTGLLKFQLEQGLAELVSTARISSDSFTGLRALLTPTKKKPSVHSRRGRRVMFSVEDAGRWSLLDTNKSDNSLVTNSRHWDVLDADQLERLVAIYLQRWGVLFRGLLERESFAPPWRVLLTALRKLELRGTIRGGRFVETVGGEQFAFPEIVDALRKFKKSEQSGKNKYYSLSAVDPLNLMNLILPNQKLSRLSKHRVLYENGIPIALLDSGKVSFLKQVDAAKEWNLRQALIKKHFPPRLSSYLGIH